MAGIYIHIPFCKQACHYCDFHFSTNRERQTEMVEAIVAEIGMQASYLREPVASIYFGGGTPSILSKNEFELIHEKINTTFSVLPSAEVTLEANPDDLDDAKLHILRSVGVNRLSIGIQSFDDNVLRFLNRAHDSKAAFHCIAGARKAGFDNISLDLIYAIPGQDSNQWEKNIDEALSLKPEHISSYSLTIEEQTVFGNWASKGKLAMVPDDDVAVEHEVLVSKLTNAGYEQYEVSNFSLPGKMAVHNSNYWKQQTYLGVGPSAHSYNRISRHFNIRNNHQYIRSIRDGVLPQQVEFLTREDQLNEYLLTGLRTSWGIDIERLRVDYNYDLFEQHGAMIQQLFEYQFATIHGNAFILTTKGRLIADKIASDLFLEKEQSH